MMKPLQRGLEDDQVSGGDSDFGFGPVGLEMLIDTYVDVLKR